jgi:predicted nuclease with RNAse H fold
MRAMGVDVSVAHGLDVVVLDESRRPVLSRARQTLPQVETALRELRPDVVAIDSPPGWASTGRSRPLERQLARLGITMYATPQDPGDHAFYRWMRVGFDVFAAADRCGYPLYRGDTAVQGRAVEVFPHASAVTLLGRLPGRGVPKLTWRLRALAEAGVEHDALRTVDQVDAALAALTGMRCLQRRFCVVGVKGDCVLALPVPALPTRRFERDASVDVEPGRDLPVTRTTGGETVPGPAPVLQPHFQSRRRGVYGWGGRRGDDG